MILDPNGHGPISHINRAQEGLCPIFGLGPSGKEAIQSSITALDTEVRREQICDLNVIKCLFSTDPQKVNLQAPTS